MHIPSLPYWDAPALYQMFREMDSVSCRVLRELLLTVARSREARFPTLDEIGGDVGIPPADHTK